MDSYVDPTHHHPLPSLTSRREPRRRAAGSSSVQSWELPDTPHTRALARHPAAYEHRVISFFDAALR
ncbi:MAG: hypothetical protein ACXV2H_02855 [Actinomycetes bacterium]